MNGRVYDPEIGRFMSADPFIQFPESTQGFNRYTYVGNNPLSAYDPSGHFLIAAIIIAYNTYHSYQAGGWDGAVKGFITSLAASGLSQGVASQYRASSLATQVIMQGISQGALSAATGGRFGDGFLGAAAGRLSLEIPGAQGPWRVIRAAIIGGTVSKIGGGKFGNGAITAAFVAMAEPPNDQDGNGAPSNVCDCIDTNDAPLGGNVTVSPDGRAVSIDVSVSWEEGVDIDKQVSQIEKEFNGTFTSNDEKDSITVQLTINKAGSYTPVVSAPPTSDFTILDCAISANCAGQGAAGYQSGNQIALWNRLAYYDMNRNQIAAGGRVDSPSHEFGHLLGFGHATHGLMSYDAVRPLRYEDVKMLRDAYQKH